MSIIHVWSMRENINLSIFLLNKYFWLGRLFYVLVIPAKEFTFTRVSMRRHCCVHVHQPRVVNGGVLTYQWLRSDLITRVSFIRHTSMCWSLQERALRSLRFQCDITDVWMSIIHVWVPTLSANARLNILVVIGGYNKLFVVPNWPCYTNIIHVWLMREILTYSLSYYANLFD
jgi:hypothetical protein